MGVDRQIKIGVRIERLKIGINRRIERQIGKTRKMDWKNRLMSDGKQIEKMED